MSIFEKLNQERPPVEQPGTKPLRREPQIERLRDWLADWDKPSVCARDIYIFGPRPRSRKTTIELAEKLTRAGWLQPIASHRRDRKVWKVVRGFQQP